MGSVRQWAVALDKTYVSGWGRARPVADECGGTILQLEMVYDDLDREIWQTLLAVQGMDVVMPNNEAYSMPRGRWVVELSAVPGTLTVDRWSLRAPTTDGGARRYEPSLQQPPKYPPTAALHLP